MLPNAKTVMVPFDVASQRPRRAVSDEREATLAIEEHAAIYRALEARDADAAASAMAVHMATASERLAAETVTPTA